MTGDRFVISARIVGAVYRDSPKLKVIIRPHIFKKIYFIKQLCCRHFKNMTGLYSFFSLSSDVHDICVMV